MKCENEIDGNCIETLDSCTGCDPSPTSDCFPNFPLEITVKLSEQSGLILGNLSIAEAQAVDAMVRSAMLVGCNTAAKHGPDNEVEKREELVKGLFG